MSIQQQFAPVGPLPVLEHILEGGFSLSYVLLLAHDVLKDPDRWLKFSQRLHFEYVDPFIIMDNSVIELGHPLPTDQLLQAYRTVEADCLVLPDALLDCDLTIHRSRMAADKLVYQDVTLLGVVQGRTPYEVLHCAESLTKIPEVRYLGVPRVLEDHGISRLQIAEMLWRSFGLQMHLLGFSDNVPADIDATTATGVMGIDSAFPVWAGSTGFAFPKDVASWAKAPPPRTGRPATYWQEEKAGELAYHNMYMVYHWMWQARVRAAADSIEVLINDADSTDTE